MFKVYVEQDVTQFTHTPKLHPGLPAVNNGEPFEVSVDITHIDAAFCGQVIFSMFDGEYLVTIHTGTGHGIGWRIIVQKSDGVAEDFGWGWMRGLDEKAENHLVESFSNALPEGLREKARFLLAETGFVSKGFETVDIG